jgi:hypothetical protein
MLRGLGSVAGQPAISPLALLVFRNSLKQMYPTELRPQCGSYIDFSVSQLPQQKIAQPHLAAGANYKVGIG